MNAIKNTFDFSFPGFGGNAFGPEGNDDLPPPSPKELTDEIKSFRQKNKEFSATNDHETYLVVCFSTKNDKNEFLNSVGIDTHTLVDGYELAKKIKAGPIRPAFKLKPPF